jgi:hypothetical protein
MSGLREAARAVVDQWDTPNRNLDMHTGVLIDRLRAALAVPETAEPVAWLHAVRSGYGITNRVLSFSAQPFPSGMALHLSDAIETISVAPLYAHPPRDEWRPASEPPEDGRSVLVWMPGKLGGLAIGRCSRGNWSPYFLGSPVTQWRDIEPPEQEGGR